MSLDRYFSLSMLHRHPQTLHETGVIRLTLSQKSTSGKMRGSKSELSSSSLCAYMKRIVSVRLHKQDELYKMAAKICEQGCGEEW